jgi:Mn-dependent DtxR family transcriptional regulator
MARHADQQQLEELRQVIERSPGQRIGAVARLLNWSREKVTRGLVMLNDRGVLFYEDERGRLWRCDKRRE